MGNIITLLIVFGVGYTIMVIIQRKQKEIADKEQKQQEMLFQEMQSLLKTEPTNPISATLPLHDNQYLTNVSEYYKKEGYLVTATLQSEGIDLFAIRDNEALFIHCETSQKQIEPDHLKTFIAECTLYLDENPTLASRTLRRVYATNRPISPEAISFLRSHPSSIVLDANH